DHETDYSQFYGLDKGYDARSRWGHEMTAKKPALGRREQNKLEKRERVRRAAWDLFTTKGFDATTTKDVAERADIATGTLFLYASDKKDLLFLVMHDRLERAV